jgi:hypothetical protein
MAAEQVAARQTVEEGLFGPGRRAGKKLGPTGWWIAGIIVLQLVMQLLLFLPALRYMRVYIRAATFSVSLFALVFMRGQARYPPAAWPALLALMWTGFQFFHPQTNSELAGLASVGLTTAIMAPLFWVTRLKVTSQQMQWALLVLWGFHTLSSVFGLLQTYFPGEFQPPLASVLVSREDYLNSLTITLASGASVYRPMGLTDTPGGVCISGFYALVLGLGFLLIAKKQLHRLVLLGSMLAGVSVIYLSQVRSVLVMSLICIIAAGGMMFITGHGGRLVKLALLALSVLVSGYVWAESIGGEAVSGRFGTLVQDNPTEVYRSNRGIFLEHTIEELVPRYPFGAGLARWGMVRSYFGVDNPTAPAEWAEIQLTGWVLDGGVPLVLLWAAAIFMTVWTGARIIRRLPTSSPLWLWSLMIFSYDFGAIGLCFNYPLFASQAGLEFWLFNGAIFAAWRVWDEEQREKQSAEAEPKAQPKVLDAGAA